MYLKYANQVILLAKINYILNLTGRGFAVYLTIR